MDEDSCKLELEYSMHTAIFNSNINELEKLINIYGINTTDSAYEQTPIFIAMEYDKKDMAEWLIAHGADINHKNAFDDTVLHVAARTGRLDMVKVFIHYGIALDIIGQDGFTPLNWATKMKHNDIAAYLIEKGASLDVPDSIFNESARDRIYAKKNQELISLIESKGL